MPEIRKPAIKIEQGNRSLFLTSFCVRDFMRDNFYRVDELDVEKSKGMQRLLNESHARSFSKDIAEATKHNQAFLPTSILLATTGNIGYDEEKKELFFESAQDAGICPLDVVDGQHRIEGLKRATRHDKFPLNPDFPVSVIIAHNLTEADQMLQFVTVNTKQQPLSKAVTQGIIAKFTEMKGVRELPYLPSWLEVQAAKGTYQKALDIALYLNSESTSPWKGRIRLANIERKDSQGAIVNQATFVQSIKSHILPKNHPLNYFPEKRNQILKNFWVAVREIFVDQSDDAILNSVAFKSIGLDFFHAISAPVFTLLAKKQKYTEQAIKDCIRSAEGYLTPDVASVMSPDFWKTSTGVAGGLNKGATSKLAAAFTEALTKASNDDIQV